MIIFSVARDLVMQELIEFVARGSPKIRPLAVKLITQQPPRVRRPRYLTNRENTILKGIAIEESAVEPVLAGCGAFPGGGYEFWDGKCVGMRGTATSPWADARLPSNFVVRDLTRESLIGTRMGAIRQTLGFNPVSGSPRSKINTTPSRLETAKSRRLEQVRQRNLHQSQLG
jgi:hypothetical protein